MKSIMIFTCLISSLKAFCADPLVQIRSVPENPQIGSEIKFYLGLNTSFKSPDGTRPYMEATLDDQATTLQNPADGLWTFSQNAYTQVGEHQIKTSLYIENGSAVDQLRKQIQTLELEIRSLNLSIQAEMDPAQKEEMIVLKQQKEAQQVALQAQIPQLRKLVRESVTAFSVNSNLDGSTLKKMIVKAQNRMHLIQNNDGGWDWFTAPDNLRNRTETSYANQFGLHGKGLIQSYKITGNSKSLEAIDKTASALYALTVQRCVRRYGTDVEFLAQSSHYLFPAYYQKAQENFQADKDCYGAITYLNNPNPTNAEVDAIDQAVLDGMTDAQRVDGMVLRLTWSGRIAGLRAFDMLGRQRNAFIMNDLTYARAFADKLAQDYSQIVISQDYYLIGLANTISGLAPFASSEPSFAAIIQDAFTKLVNQQQNDGLFLVTEEEGVSGGTIQDQAFIAKALLDMNTTESLDSLAKLIGYLSSQQVTNGGYRWFFDLGDDQEFIEGDSELLGYLSEIYSAHFNTDYKQFLGPVPRTRIVFRPTLLAQEYQ